MREYFSGGITMTVTDGCFRLSTDSMVLADFCRLPRGAAVCDLGSGCGALGLLLLRDHPDMRVTGLEILPDAAAQARKNIDANHLSEHFSVITGDLREHRALLPANAFDAVVSNPPGRCKSHCAQRDLLHAGRSLRVRGVCAALRRRVLPCP